jgi:signal transduction histidine kinase/ligand-binding sensor domain-containing protein
MIKGRFFQIAAAFIALAPAAFAQRNSDWRIFRAGDGLSESPCVSVTVNQYEKVLTKHINSDSINELNGYTITSFPSPEVGRNRVYGGAGGQLWTVTSGGLAEFIDGKWKVHPIPEIAKFANSVAPLVAPPIPIQVIRQGRVLILLPDQLLLFSDSAVSVLQSANGTGLGKFLGMAVARDGTLWISGPHGLERSTAGVRNLKAEDAWHESATPPGVQAQDFEQPIQDVDGEGLTCVANLPKEQKRCVVHFENGNWTVQPMRDERICGAWRSADGTTWAVTQNTVLQIDNLGTAAANLEEIFNGDYFDVAVQTNGTFWVASREGLLRYSPPLWKTPRELRSLNSLVTCLAEDVDSRLWFISAGALHSLENGNDLEHNFPRNLRPFLQSVRVLLPLKNGDMLLDNGEELFQFQPRAGPPQVVASGPNEHRHTLGVFRDGSIAVETTEGAAQKCRFEKYDGTSFKPFPTTPPDCSGTAFIETQNGDLWLGGDHGVACFHEKQWLTFSNNTVPAPAVAFVETAAGKLWCATPDSIWELSGQNWSVLRSGFDQINSLIRSHDGNIWVASNGGIERFVQDAWIENSVDEGLPNANARRVYEDRKGRIWAATPHGLTLFHPEVDHDPPLTEIRRTPEEETIPQNVTVNTVFSGRDKWKFTPNDRLLYSYRLDQHDWSEFLDANLFRFPDLAPGPHSLEARAMDRNGNIESRPAQMTFSIALPWYQETRLVLISFLGTVSALFFAALALNRHRQLLRSYAEVERKVAERTRELEITSRELVHSQKMNALGTLAAGIAHDFNNILSIIKGSAQIIEDNVGNTDKVRVRVDRIKTVVEQGAGIVKAMLGFSAGTSDEPVPCDLNKVVNDTIQLLGDRFQRDTAVMFNPEPGLPEVPVVKEFLQQILLNFVFNAAEAETTARQKQIIVSLRTAERLPPNLVLAPAAAKHYVLVSVQDFGCGIDPETLPRIFEPFFTTKAFSARRGTGLGLSMVYELARKLAAGLSVESIVDVGSTFTLILPIRKIEEAKMV